MNMTGHAGEHRAPAYSRRARADPQKTIRSRSLPSGRPGGHRPPSRRCLPGPRVGQPKAVKGCLSCLAAGSAECWVHCNWRRDLVPNQPFSTCTASSPLCGPLVGNLGLGQADAPNPGFCGSLGIETNQQRDRFANPTPRENEGRGWSGFNEMHKWVQFQRTQTLQDGCLMSTREDLTGRRKRFCRKMPKTIFL